MADNNKPIGVPSGWEEVAAYCYGMDRLGANCVYPVASLLAECSEDALVGEDAWTFAHDWRVEE